MYASPTLSEEEKIGAILGIIGIRVKRMGEYFSQDRKIEDSEYKVYNEDYPMMNVRCGEKLYALLEKVLPYNDDGTDYPSYRRTMSVDIKGKSRVIPILESKYMPFLKPWDYEIFIDEVYVGSRAVNSIEEWFYAT